MLFKSTRDIEGVHLKEFEEVLLSAYAPDGGLFVPALLPQLSIVEMGEWKRNLKSFPEVCAEVIALFTSGIEIDELNRMTSRAFKDFNSGNSSDPLPISKLGDLILLDTSLGPTYAFKDIGQQIMGQLINHVLGKRGQKANIIIETSGDTGPAAIAGVKGCEHVEIYCLYPHNRVSPVQELQMIAIQEKNVHVFRTEGDTDEQASVLKEVFSDLEFVKQYNVCSVNSINWFRIAAQASYYFWSYFQVVENIGDPVSYIIPTGAFGNAMGGYLAKKMGLPIERIICATNANDIVHRTIAYGDMRMAPNIQTESPAMDIQFAYNLERMLYYVTDEDASVVREIMSEVEKQYRFQSDGLGVQLSAEIVGKIQAFFSSVSMSDALTLATMRTVYYSKGIVLCPHSAISVHAGMNDFHYLLAEESNMKLVCVLTANYCKFESAVRRAIGEEEWGRLTYPESIKLLEVAPKIFQLLSKPPGDQSVWRDHWVKAIKESVIANS